MILALPQGKTIRWYRLPTGCTHAARAPEANLATARRFHCIDWLLHPGPYSPAPFRNLEPDAGSRWLTLTLTLTSTLTLALTWKVTILDTFKYMEASPPRVFLSLFVFFFVHGFLKADLETLFGRRSGISWSPTSRVARPA